MGCRSDLRKLLIKLQDMENVSVEVKQSACQLLEDLQEYLANSQIGLLKAQREAVRVFLETLEIGICGRVPLPIDLFEAIQIATKAELPKGMPHSISGANRCVPCMLILSTASLPLWRSSGTASVVTCTNMRVVSNGMKALR
eukprot:gene12091-8642_t